MTKGIVLALGLGLVANLASASCLQSVQQFLGVRDGEKIEFTGSVLGSPQKSCSTDLTIRREDQSQQPRLRPRFNSSKQEGLKPEAGGAFWPFASFALYPSQLQSGEIWECVTSTTSLRLRDRSRQNSGRFLDIELQLQKGPRPGEFFLSYGEGGMNSLVGSFSTHCQVRGQIREL
ncbi:MAG: hypothetical protein ACK5Y2_11510 [Bdellovibrionales bacterium]